MRNAQKNKFRSRWKFWNSSWAVESQMVNEIVTLQKWNWQTAEITYKRQKNIALTTVLSVAAAAFSGCAEKRGWHREYCCRKHCWNNCRRVRPSRKIIGGNVGSRLSDKIFNRLMAPAAIYSQYADCRSSMNTTKPIIEPFQNDKQPLADFTWRGLLYFGNL